MKSMIHLRLLASSFIVLCLGWIIYACFRTANYPLIPHVETSVRLWIPALILGSGPSLLHVWALSMLSAGLAPTFSARHHLVFPLFWLLVNLAFEAGQLIDKHADILHLIPKPLADYFIQGRFDSLDLLACCVGAILGYLSIRLSSSQTWNLRPNSLPSRRTLASCLAMIFGCLSIMATSKVDPNAVRRRQKIRTPVVMSNEEFRTSFSVAAPQAIKVPGKIYLIDSFLLVSDVNQGVHILDNTDPKAPKPLAFLKILGNHDIAVRNNILYADSFIDLLAIDIANKAEPKLVQRIEDVFPWDPASWFDLQAWEYDSIDPKKEIIIGFEVDKQQ